MAALTYGYVRVSTDEQARSGLGLEAQRAAIGDVDRWVEDAGVSASVPPDERPALGPVLARLRAGDVLTVSRLDRIARSVADFSDLLRRAEADGWSLRVLDLGLDMGTPMGRFVAQVMAAVAELEREMIGQRISDALRAKQARGEHVGAPRLATPDQVERVRRMRLLGWPHARIARRLNELGVATPSGNGRWHASTVARVASYAAERTQTTRRAPSGSSTGVRSRR